MSVKNNLPSQPYKRWPLVRGSEVSGPAPSTATPSSNGTGSNGGPSVYSGRPPISIASLTFSFRMAGTVNTAFPNAIRVASQSFNMAVGVLSVSLSTSMNNASNNAVLAVFAAQDSGAVMGLTSSMDVYVEHLCEASCIASYRSGVTYADDVAPTLGSGKSIALYCSSSGSNYIGNSATGICTVRYFQVNP